MNLGQKVTPLRVVARRRTSGKEDQELGVGAFASIHTHCAFMRLADLLRGTFRFEIGQGGKNRVEAREF